MKLFIIHLMSFLNCFICRLKGLKIGKNAIITGFPFISNKGGTGSIIIKDNVTIHSLRKANGVLTNRTALITGTPNAKIILENSSGVSGSTIFSTSLISVGEGTLIGADTLILDNDMHIQNSQGLWVGSHQIKGTGKPIIIGKNCFIGARAIILKGVTIGDNCVVGAGSVITKNIPSNHMAYGNPPIIKSRQL